ncbi:type III-B CRISPR module RAMP protein Cmr6 [Candidatus Desulforudis audaxviator]|uniref:CRISPR-associated RAMP protein, Cmr6 family n=1 Tax=Desulforudis audaxviator (strain MP104C) TaxID=477974 RepID=B1I5K5_DESAP|nr:type III-B CRISPR module RAMP protein Cmr6 [Candidatus Desulforudis audaxviator]ACA60314.1 CRISPR-associated RAMP protein, Cmr6 family [Candidatus Desulforudis audaxviator MP104C]AZK60362.1 CRISPR-associated RAMP Cmr6 [Candidatus Desulforudis audaxviator]
MSTRRTCLVSARKTPTTNAGLWLDKFIRNQAREDKDSRHDLVREVSDIPVPEEYSRWFERWRRVLQDYGAACRVAEVLGRIAVGLGEESVLETSVALHHTYGVPYIPGSALKGLAASFARQYLGDDWQANAGAYKTVFGDTDTAGYVIFFDALPLPGSRLLYPDVITVHHEGYYQKGDKPPADWDSPNPVPFLSATGKYLVALAGPDAWVKAAFEILQYALLNLGVGAKTSSGYGRLRLESVPPITGVEDRKVDQLINQIRALRTSEVAGRIQAFYEQWWKLDVSPEHKRRIAEAIVAKVKEAGREKQSLDKDWYRELLESLR